jgi:hypothetical protein
MGVSTAIALFALALLFGQWWVQEAKLISPTNARYLLLIAISFFLASIVIGTWSWARNYLLLFAIAFLIVTVFVVIWPWIGVGHKKRIEAVPIETRHPVGSYNNIQMIRGYMPSNRPPVLLKVIMTACCLIILAFGLLTIYLWIAGEIVGQITLAWIYFFVVFIVLPILGLLDIYICEKKYYELGKSARAKGKTIILHGDINEVFNKCLKVIDTRIGMRTDSRIIIMDRPKLIKAIFGDSILTVKARYIQNNKVRIDFLSDSQWVTTKIDFGVNQRNVDKFDRLIRSEMNQDNNTFRVKA